MFFKLQLRSVLLALILTTQSAYPEQLYFLCGSDEDGCPDGYEKYCQCIPLNVQQENLPYSFDFDNMSCQLLSEQPDCATPLIFKNQASCIATIFQSEPNPPCKVVSESFCHLHFIYVCDQNGNPDSCKN